MSPFPEGHAKAAMMQDKVTMMQEILLYQRDIEPVNICTGCRGWGIKMYSSTSTWRGGIGGQALTNGICDECWGSGDKTKRWLDLRLFSSLATAIHEVHNKFHPQLLGEGIKFEECPDRICATYQLGVRR